MGAFCFPKKDFLRQRFHLIPDEQAIRGSGIELEYPVRRSSWRIDRTRICRDTPLDMDDFAAQQPDDIDRETHPLHPEGIRSRPIEDKEHRTRRTETITLTETERTLIIRISNLESIFFPNYRHGIPLRVRNIRLLIQKNYQQSAGEQKHRCHRNDYRFSVP